MYAMFYFINTSLEITEHVSVRYMGTSYRFVFVLVSSIEISYHFTLDVSIPMTASLDRVVGVMCR